MDREDRRRLFVISSVFLEVVTPVFRRQLENNYRKSGFSCLQDFLNKPQIVHKLFHLNHSYKWHCCVDSTNCIGGQNLPLYNYQWKLLYTENPGLGNHRCHCKYTAKPVQLDELDITLMGLVLINCFTLGSAEELAVRSLRRYKNDNFSHNTSGGISEPKYNSLWPDLEYQIIQLDPTRQSDLDKMKNRPLDEQLCETYNTHLSDLNKRLEEFEVNLKETNTSVQGIRTDVHGINTSLQVIGRNIHGTDRSVQRVNSSLQGIERSVQGGNITLQGIERSVQEGNTTLQGLERAMQGGNTTLKSLEKAMKRGNTTLKGLEKAMQGGITTLQGIETAVQEGNTTLQGLERAIKGGITTLQGIKTAVQEGNTTLQSKDGSVQGINTCMQKIYSLIQRDVQGSLLMNDKIQKLLDHAEKRESIDYPDIHRQNRKSYKLGQDIFYPHHQFTSDSCFHTPFGNAVITDDGHIAYIRWGCNSVKIYNIDGSPVGTIQLRGQPWDITVVNNSTVAITLGNCRCIDIWDINNKQMVKSIPLSLPCIGITTLSNKFVVGCEGRMLIIDPKTEKVEKTIDTDGYKPIKLCGSGDGVFYTDCNRYYLNHYSHSKNKIYTKDLPSDVCGMTTLQDGSVYVICKDGSVQHVSSDGEKYTTSTTNGGTLPGCLTGIHYNPVQKKLAITNGNAITVLNEY